MAGHPYGGGLSGPARERYRVRSRPPRTTYQVKGEVCPDHNPGLTVKRWETTVNVVMLNVEHWHNPWIVLVAAVAFVAIMVTYVILAIRFGNASEAGQ